MKIKWPGLSIYENVILGFYFLLMLNEDRTSVLNDGTIQIIESVEPTEQGKIRQVYNKQSDPQIRYLPLYLIFIL